MTECFFCKKLTHKTYVYYNLDICHRCYLQLKLGKLKNSSLPEDTYLKSLVERKEQTYVDALNHFATLFPKTLSRDLLGIIPFSSDKNDEIDSVFANSMIIAARSVLLFGVGTKEKTKTNEIHALHSLGNLVGISIMGNLTNSYKNKNLEDEAIIMAICADIDRIMVDILNGIDENDDGCLHDLIAETMDLIKIGEVL